MMEHIKKTLLAFSIALLLVGMQCEDAASETARITIHAAHYSSSDTMVLYFWPEQLVPYDYSQCREFRAHNEGGTYSFAIDSVAGLSWMTVGNDQERLRGRILYPLLSLYIVAPGDDVEIDVEPQPGRKGRFGITYDSERPISLGNYSCRFRGDGSAKYTAKWKTDSTFGIWPQPYDRRDTSKVAADRLDHFLQNEVLFDELIDPYREDMGEEAYQLLKSEWIGLTQYVYPLGFKDDLRNAVARMPVLGQRISDSLRARSPNYLYYLTQKIEIDRYVWAGQIGAGNVYKYIHENIGGKLGTRLAAHIVVDNTRSADFNVMLADAIGWINDSFCEKVLAALMTRTIGSRIYDFVLPDKEGNLISLKDFRGKTVFLDFYYSGCGPCMSYYKHVVKPVHRRYRANKEVIFMSISIDTRHTFLKVVGTGKYTSPDAINLYTRNKGSSHPLIRSLAVKTYPTPVLIYGDGRIAAIGSELRTRKGLMDNIDRVLADMK